MRLAPIPAADPARPEPKCHQIWSTHSPAYGRRFILIESVRLRAKDDCYVNAIECGQRGGPVHTVKGTCRGLPFYIVTPNGAMPSCYQFEKEVS